MTRHLCDHDQFVGWVPVVADSQEEAGIAIATRVLPGQSASVPPPFHSKNGRACPQQLSCPPAGIFLCR